VLDLCSRWVPFVYFPLFVSPIGTITEVDSNDHMVDSVGMGYTERRKINEKIINETMSYRDGFRTMVESVHRPFAEMEALVRKGELSHSVFHSWSGKRKLSV
jgi:2-hydroxy-3-keto-5-methylthiopentenyl-1-phosphate phosphatase